MKILVIDDKAAHQASALETLAGHEVTILDSFEAAMRAMQPTINNELRNQLMTEAGLPVSCKHIEEEERKTYWRAWDEAGQKSVVPFPFDVVLTDMMMPMAKETLADGVFDPRVQMPYGFVIALEAARRGAKFVAMLTDTNHHKGPMSAALDYFGPAYYPDVDDCIHEKPVVFTINGASAVFVHTPFVERVESGVTCDWCVEKPGACTGCLGTGFNKNPDYHPRECHECGHSEAVGKCRNCKGAGTCDRITHLDSKDWGRVLRDLMARVE